MGEAIYMLPNDMNLKIKSETAGYNNEILVFDSGFSLGRNDRVNVSVPEKLSHKASIKHAPMPKAAHTQSSEAKLMQEEERVALVLFLTSALGIWYAFC